MNAWIVSPRGPLALAQLPLTPLAPTKVRVRVRYAGVGFADVMAAAGGYPLAPRPPFSPGYEFAGVVEALGTEAQSDLVVGQRVAGMLPTMGAYREVLDLDPVWAVPVPRTLDDATAALVPLNYLTAAALLDRLTNLKAGQSFLIHGAAGGVGSAVLELARDRSLRAYGTAHPAKWSQLEPGVTPLDSSGAWDEELRRREPRGVDAAFDSFGGRSLERSWKVLGSRGTLVSYGFSPTPGGGWGPLLAGLASVAGKFLVSGGRAKVLGTPRIVDSHRDWYRTTLSGLFDQVAQGSLKPRLHAILPFTEALWAHELIVRRQATGKLLLEFPS